MTKRSVKCLGKTKAGGPCVRYTVKEGRCSLHQPQDLTNAFMTITFCECSENNVGMEKNGGKAEIGLTIGDFKSEMKWANKNGLVTHLYKLHDLLKGVGDDGVDVKDDEKEVKDDEVEVGDDLLKGVEDDEVDVEDDEKAWVLVIKDVLGHLGINQKEIFTELMELKWDDKYFDQRRKRVLNKHARKNCCFGDVSQKADFKNKKGTIYKFEDIKPLNKIRLVLGRILGEKAKGLLAEGNLYCDGGEKKHGIGFHGDSERRLVVGFRFSLKNKTPDLHYKWFEKSKVISKVKKVALYSGDMYVMSQKAAGTDWKKRSIRTLRHATGAKKYVGEK